MALDVKESVFCAANGVGTDVEGSMDLMNGQAGSVTTAATASEVRRSRSLLVKFLTWHSNSSSTMVGHTFKSELEKRSYQFFRFLKTSFNGTIHMLTVPLRNSYSLPT